MEDHRRFRRHQIPLEVELIHESTGVLRAQAKDMSEGGLFLLLDEYFQLELGTEVTVRSLGLGPSGDEIGPEVSMKVVRSCPEGMGLEILRGQDTHITTRKDEAGNISATKSSSGRSILQRLVVMDDNDQILLWHQGDHWHLPCRELQNDESWQSGLLACIEKLEKIGAVTDRKDLQTAQQCFPSNNDTEDCIELLIPCRYLRNGHGTQEKPGAIRWEPLSKLAELGSIVDEEVLETLTTQL